MSPHPKSWLANWLASTNKLANKSWRKFYMGASSSSSSLDVTEFISRSPQSKNASPIPIPMMTFTWHKLVHHRQLAGFVKNNQQNVAIRMGGQSKKNKDITLTMPTTPSKTMTIKTNKRN